MRLMQYQGQTVSVLGGTVRVKLPDDMQMVVPVMDLDDIPGLLDGGPLEGSDQWVKLILSEDQKSILIESNGIFPEDMARFLALALHTVESGNEESEE